MDHWSKQLSLGEIRNVVDDFLGVRVFKPKKICSNTKKCRHILILFKMNNLMVLSKNTLRFSKDMPNSTMGVTAQLCKMNRLLIGL